MLPGMVGEDQGRAEHRTEPHLGVQVQRSGENRQSCRTLFIPEPPGTPGLGSSYLARPIMIKLKCEVKQITRIESN